MSQYIKIIQIWLTLMMLKRKHKKNNSNWPWIPDHPYRTLIIGGPGSGKTNSFFNLINQQPDFDKMYLYAKDPYEVSAFN